MTRRDDLIQFFLCANSSQQSRNFDLCKYVDDYLIRNPSEALILPIVVKSVKEKEILTFEDWLENRGYKQIGKNFVYKNGNNYEHKECLSKLYRDEYPL